MKSKKINRERRVALIKDGEIIRIYPNYKEAAKVHNFSDNYIMLLCRDLRKQTKEGLQFRYLSKTMPQQRNKILRYDEGRLSQLLHFFTKELAPHIYYRDEDINQ
jgi:hypothetical protein